MHFDSVTSRCISRHCTVQIITDREKETSTVKLKLYKPPCMDTHTYAENLSYQAVNTELM